MSFPYELGFEELVDLLADRHVSFGVEPSAFLDNRLVRRIDVEPVDNNYGIDFEHAFMGLGKYISVFFKEADELVPKASQQL